MHRPKTGNLYPGSVIDTLATVWQDSDRPDLKRSLNVFFSNFSLKVSQNALTTTTFFSKFSGSGDFVSGPMNHE